MLVCDIATREVDFTLDTKQWLSGLDKVEPDSDEYIELSSFATLAGRAIFAGIRAEDFVPAESTNIDYERRDQAMARLSMLIFNLKFEVYSAVRDEAFQAISAEIAANQEATLIVPDSL